MRYISLFSGVGGLEHRKHLPLFYVERDPKAGLVLARSGVPVLPDVTTLKPPSADVVIGGWPCQDLSQGGKRAGLSGARSGLFYQLVRIAVESGAHTVVAENVTEVLRPAYWNLVASAFTDAGFPFLNARVLNSREFGLPQQRRRAFMIATKHQEIAASLSRPLPPSYVPPKRWAAGFYTTAGTFGINYGLGYSPTLKVGSGFVDRGKGKPPNVPSPPGVFYEDVVRKLSAEEALLLQGFDPARFLGLGLTDADVHRMAGNAVSLPVGRWVMDSVEAPISRQYLPEPLADNLGDFIDWSSPERLSARAASGLLRRLSKSGKPCPDELRFALEQAAAQGL